MPITSSRWPGRFLAAVLGAVVGVAAAMGYLSFRQEQFASEAAILVLPAIPVQDLGLTDRLNMETEVEVLQSIQVAQAVQESTGTTRSIDWLLGHVQAFVKPNSQVLSLVMLGDSPEEAQLLAAAFSEQYLALRGAEAEQAMSTVADSLEGQLSDFQKELGAVASAVSEAEEGSAPFQLASARQAIIIAQINETNSQLLRLRAASANPGRVIASASLPSSGGIPTSATLALAGLLGATAGLASWTWLQSRSARRGQAGPHLSDGTVGQVGMGQPPEVEGTASMRAVTRTMPGNNKR